MDPLALAGLAALLFAKEAGLPVPVPGDLLVVTAGIAAVGPGVPAWLVLGVILAAGYAGGSLQFMLVRGALRERLLRVLARVGVGRERLDALAAWLARRGARGVALARATPGVRIGATTAAGLAGLPFRVFVAGLVVGNAAFVGGHFGLGLVIGPPALALAAQLGTLGVALLVLGLLAVLGAVGWRRLRRSGSGYAGWAEGACPACLALTVAGGGRDGSHPERLPSG
jgi:membrane protein DedA with SNARE-associated domain